LDTQTEILNSDGLILRVIDQLHLDQNPIFMKRSWFEKSVVWLAGWLPSNRKSPPAPPSPADSGYDPRHRKIRRVLEWLRKIGVECGVHPGYATFRSPEKLRREVSILRDLLGPQPLGGRQHYLRWCPDTWIDWENCGLAYDSSVGYADQIGFRAGTCIPYRPWIFSLNRQSDLLEIPLLVTDRTLVVKMKLEKAEALQAVDGLLARCKAVGGVFTLLWHNDSFLEPAYREIYLCLLKTLSGAENYNWQADEATSSAF
jgi:hypothetical protein